MKKFFNKFQKPYFWPIFGPFSQFLGQKNFFLENAALSHTTSYGFLAPCQNLEKTNYTIPRKRLDRRKDGWKDRRMEGQNNGRTDRPYSIGPFQLSPGVHEE